MPIEKQTSYLALLLMLATLSNVEMSPAQATIAPENETIPERISRIKEVLKQKSFTLDKRSSLVSFQDESINENEVSFWGDWSDRGGRRGGSGGWVDAWSPGWGDWADTSRWGDWADLW